ncbi:hypothetical protein GVAV_001712 [Gurleya vavrai]
MLNLLLIIFKNINSSNTQENEAILKIFNYKTSENNFNETNFESYAKNISKNNINKEFIVLTIHPNIKNSKFEDLRFALKKEVLIKEIESYLGRSKLLNKESFKCKLTITFFINNISFSITKIKNEQKLISNTLSEFVNIRHKKFVNNPDQIRKLPNADTEIFESSFILFINTDKMIEEISHFFEFLSKLLMLKNRSNHMEIYNILYIIDRKKDLNIEKETKHISF